MNTAIALSLLALAVAGVVIRKTYYSVPAHELKRQAEKQDQLARQLYRAVAYGSSLRILLWFFIAATSAGGFVMLARHNEPWISFVVVIGVLWSAFSWLPATRVTKLGARLTTLVTPLIVLILNYLHPLLDRFASFAEKRYTASPHTGLFERDDLLKIINRQQQQQDNRVSTEELEIARRALSFDDFTVAEILTPRKKLKTILADETIGPILIDELHKSGEEFALVRESKKGPVIGTLAYDRLTIHSKGTVRDAMNGTVYYLHENDSLSEALHAFFVTNHPMFIVVNSFEEFVGIATVESILRQLLGHLPGEDFDQYADVSAVAARYTKPQISDEAVLETLKAEDLDLPGAESKNNG